VKTRVKTAPAFASASEALEMVQAGLGYLAAADATAMPAKTQALCLQMLERAHAMGTAARGRGRPWSGRSSARRSTCSRARAGWPRS